MYTYIAEVYVGHSLYSPFFKSVTFSHACARSSFPASGPVWPSRQHVQQYNSPAQPRQRTTASARQIAHQESISASVYSTVFVLFLEGGDNVWDLGAEGRFWGRDGKEGSEVGAEGR